jgi:Fe2+ transport system protein B
MSVSNALIWGDKSNDRVVTEKQGRKLSEKWGCTYWEVSAKTGVNIEPVFQQIIKQVKESRNHEFTIQRGSSFWNLALKIKKNSSRNAASKQMMRNGEVTQGLDCLLGKRKACLFFFPHWPPTG